MSEDDRDLRQEFDALRLAAAADAPTFAATVAAARHRTTVSMRRRSLVLAAAALIAGIALALVFVRHRAGSFVDLATVRWESPTDFLLRLPGDELLRTVPTLGLDPSTMNWRMP